MGKTCIVDIHGNRYRYEYDESSGKTVYRVPVGDAPPLNEEEFERWAVYREDKDMDPKQLERFYNDYIESDDVETALDETYAAVENDSPTRSDYVLLPGHTHIIAWTDDPEEPVWLTPPDPNIRRLAYIKINNNTFVGEFDSLEEVIEAVQQDALKRQKAWEAEGKTPRAWVEAKGKKAKPDWKPEED